MAIKVPHITVSIDHGDDATFGELSLVALGYGLHQAWIYSSMFDSGSIFGGQSLITVSLVGNMPFTYFISIAIYGLLLLAASAFDEKLIRPMRSKGILLSAAVCCFLGTSMLLLPTEGAGRSLAFEIVSGALTGIGSVPLLLNWGIAFARQETPSIVLNGVLSIIIGFAVYAFALHQIPFPFGAVISAFIPLVELLLLMKLYTEEISRCPAALGFSSLPINHSKFLLRFGLPVFLLGFALGVMRESSIRFSLLSSTFFDQTLVFLSAGCASVLILSVFFMLGSSEKWDSLFRPLVPIIAVTIVIMPFADNQPYQVFSTGCVLTGYIAFEALMWIFFGELSQRFRLSPIFVFGLGRGLMAIAMLCGSLSPALIEPTFTDSALGDVVIVFVLLVLMMAAYALLPDESEIAAITTFAPTKMRASGRARGGVCGADGDRDGERDVCDVRDMRDAADVCEARDDKASLNVGEEAAPPAHRIRHSAIVVTPTEARTINQPSPSAFSSIFEQEGKPTPALDVDAESEHSRFRARCENIANTYLLSKREAEVMFYLARGYKSSYIQETLYISEGTAKTHIRHIYRKVNVHSQQELMRLVDTVEII